MLLDCSYSPLNSGSAFNFGSCSNYVWMVLHYAPTSLVVIQTPVRLSVKNSELQHSEFNLVGQVALEGQRLS